MRRALVVSWLGVCAIGCGATRTTASEPTGEPDAPDAAVVVVAEAPSDDERIDALLATSGPIVPPPTPPATRVPSDTPTRADVMAAMRSVEAAVRACAPGATGTVSVRVVFDGPTGRAVSAEVEGALAHSDVAPCIARAMRDASVPPFVQPSMTATLPFRLATE